MTLRLHARARHAHGPGGADQCAGGRAGPTGQHGLRRHRSGVPAAGRRGPRRGARGGLRGAHERRHRALLQPRGAGADEPPRGDGVDLQLRRQHPVHVGGDRSADVGRVPGGGAAGGVVRVLGPAGVHAGGSRRHRGDVFGVGDVPGGHLQPELLRPLLGGLHGEDGDRSSGVDLGDGVCAGLRDQLPRDDRGAADPGGVRDPEPGHEPAP